MVLDGQAATNFLCAIAQSETQLPCGRQPMLLEILHHFRLR